jgi:uncharacterized protein YukE
MASILTHANISDAKDAIDTYVSTCNTIYESFIGTMNNLSSSGWNGEATEGCKDFTNGTVSLALTDGISQIATQLTKILDDVENALLNQCDPQLGNANRNPGG